MSGTLVRTTPQNSSKSLELRRWVGAAVVCLILFSSLPATADTWIPTEALIIAIGLELGIHGTSLTYAIGNFVYAYKGERASSGWRTGGWITSGISLAAGIGFLAASSHNKWDEGLLSLGVAHLVVGSIDFGVTIWSSCQPEKKEQKLTLAPMIMPDARGNAAFGVGLRLVDW